MAGIDKILLGGSTILGIEDEENRKEVEKLKNPEFSDTGNVAGITSFPGFLAKVKSKMDIFGFFRDFKAGMQFILHTGQIVNNCVSDRADLPLAAKQGKILAEELAKLNSDINPTNYVHGSLLTYAENISEGFHIIVVHDNTEDTPCSWGKGYIIRIQNDITIVLHQATINRVFINQRPAAKNWIGWEHYIITSDLTPTLYQVPQPEATDIFLSFNHWNVDLIKSGHIVTLRININGEMAATDDIKPLFTLPKEYCPNLALIWNYITQSGDRILIEIKPSGEVLLSNFGKTLSGGTSNNNAWFCRQCITYITDK